MIGHLLSANRKVFRLPILREEKHSGREKNNIIRVVSVADLFFATYLVAS